MIVMNLLEKILSVLMLPLVLLTEPSLYPLAVALAFYVFWRWDR